MAADRKASEQKALDAVRGWLPELQVGTALHIEAIDPKENDGSFFSVGRAPAAFVCRRGGEADHG